MGKFEPLIKGDWHYLAMLTLAYIRKKKAVLIFCPYRKECEDRAIFIADNLPQQFVEYKKVPVWMASSTSAAN